MGDPVVVESWHVPRALSDKALRLLTTLPMDEIERRLRVPMAADGEVAELPPRPPLMKPPAHLALERYGITWDGSPDKPLLTRMADGYWTPWHVAALLLERQALRPISVSERLPEPKDCDAEGRCWWGDAGDDQFVPSWRLCEQPDDTHFIHWLPAHALPLPEVNDD